MKKILLLLLPCLFLHSELKSQAVEIDPGEVMIFHKYVPYLPDRSPHVNCADIFNLKQYWGTQSPDVVYVLENQPVVSFVYPIGDKIMIYLQDVSGGIVLISGPDGPVSPFVKIGDSLNGIAGYATLIGGTIVLIPVAAPSLVSQDNPVYPQQIDVMTMMLNPNVYESALVQLQNVSMNGGETLFEVDKNYIVYQESSTTALQTLFPEANYIGTPIPTASFNLTGVVNFNHFTGEVTVTPRFLADFGYSYGNDKNGSWLAEDVFSADGYLKVRSSVRQQLSVFTVLGQLVYQEYVDPGLSEVNLPTGGVYVVKMGKLVKRIVIP